MRLIICSFLLAISLYSFSQARIKVLSYNIFHGELVYEKGKPNLDSIASLINKLQPDFVFCQEVDSATGRSAGLYGKKTDFIKELAAKTGMQGYFGKAMDYDSGGYGEGMLSRNPVHANVTVLPSPAGGEPRSLIYANVRLMNGQNVIIGGTHLCHEFEQNRLAQVENINNIYRNLLVPSIVCGDFNFESNQPPYQVMLQYWKDAATLRMKPPNTFSSKDPSKRIDYAFVTKRGNWRLVNAETFPVTYSDHLPVLFTLELTIAE
ncbi:MAG: endonuclease/exonuclease/phosphatase family protein [Chitinophagaceae bacterium]